MKIKRKTLEKIKKYSLITFSALLIASFFYFTYWFLTNNISRINFINVSGANPAEKNIYLIPKIATIIINDKRFFFLPADHIVTYNKNKIINLIKTELPNIKDIKIKTKGLHTLNIEIISYTPVFNLYNGSALSEEGVSYKELINTDNLPTLLASTTPNKILIRDIKSLMKKISPVLFNINKIVIDEYSDIHLINSETGSEVLFKSKDNVDKLWNTLISAVDTNPLKDNLKDSNQRLLYIDLRFGNKVYYKFTNSKVKDIIATTTKNNETATSTRVLAEPNR